MARVGARAPSRTRGEAVPPRGLARCGTARPRKASGPFLHLVAGFVRTGRPGAALIGTRHRARREERRPWRGEPHGASRHRTPFLAAKTSASGGATPQVDFPPPPSLPLSSWGASRRIFLFRTPPEAASGHRPLRAAKPRAARPRTRRDERPGRAPLDQLNGPLRAIARAVSRAGRPAARCSPAVPASPPDRPRRPARAPGR
jgi:hypothetical protein